MKNRLAAFIEARADAKYHAAYQAAEDALTNERHNVRALQRKLADCHEAIANLNAELDERDREHVALVRHLGAVELERDELLRGVAS